MHYYCHSSAMVLISSILLLLTLFTSKTLVHCGGGSAPPPAVGSDHKDFLSSDEEDNHQQEISDPMREEAERVNSSRGTMHAQRFGMALHARHVGEAETNATQTAPSVPAPTSLSEDQQGGAAAVEGETKNAAATASAASPGKLKSFLSGGKSILSRGAQEVKQHVWSPSRVAAGKFAERARVKAQSGASAMANAYGRATSGRGANPSGGTVGSGAAVNEAQITTDNRRVGGTDQANQQRSDQKNDAANQNDRAAQVSSVGDDSQQQPMPQPAAESTAEKGQTVAGEAGSDATAAGETGNNGCPLKSVPSAAMNLVTKAGQTVGPPLKNAAGWVATTAHHGVVEPAFNAVKPVAEPVYKKVVEPAFNTVVEPAYRKALKPAAQLVHNTAVVPAAHGISTMAGTVSRQMGKVTEWRDNEQQPQQAKKQGEEAKTEKGEEGTN